MIETNAYTEGESRHWVNREDR